MSIDDSLREVIGEAAYDFKTGARRAGELARKFVTESVSSAITSVKVKDPKSFKKIKTIIKLCAL